MVKVEFFLLCAINTLEGYGYNYRVVVLGDHNVKVLAIKHSCEARRLFYFSGPIILYSMAVLGSDMLN